MHDLNARNRTVGCPKRLETQHGTRQPFHCSVTLSHEVLEIFRVADNNRDLVCLVIMHDRCRIRPTLIDGDFLWKSLGMSGFV